MLTTVFNETEKGHAMQTPNCTTAPTGAQTEAAMQLVQTTSSAVAKYKDLSVAKAAGYVPITDPRYPVVHYLNYSVHAGQYVLDPNHVQSLVYAFTPYGPVLVAAMYLMPSVGDKGPMPGGCLTQWHAHTNLCTGGPSGHDLGLPDRRRVPGRREPAADARDAARLAGPGARRPAHDGPDRPADRRGGDHGPAGWPGPGHAGRPAAGGQRAASAPRPPTPDNRVTKGPKSRVSCTGLSYLARVLQQLDT